MCGIFAYLHYNLLFEKQKSISYLINGLKRLEYRGYDSAGICVQQFDTKNSSNNNLEIIKDVGNVAKLELLVKKSLLNSTMKSTRTISMAHTRWATHGAPSSKNSHPHCDSSQEFATIHNGIIYNYTILKTMLEKEGYFLFSDTDTEVIPVLMKYLFDSKTKSGVKISFLDLLRETLTYVNGTYALVIMSKQFPGEIVAARKGSPLLLGIKLGIPALESNSKGPKTLSSQEFGGLSSSSTSNSSASKSTWAVKQLSLHIQELENKNTPIELFLASDPSAIIEHTRSVIFFEDNELLHVNPQGLFQFATTDSLIDSKQTEHITTKLEEIMKGNYESFMEKEIHEQYTSIPRAFQGRIRHDQQFCKLGGVESHLHRILASRRLIFIACGTSFNSCLATRHIVETLSGLPVYVELASDFDDRQPQILFSDTVIFVSQSGETSDTLVCLDYCKSRGALCLGIVNNVGSTIARQTDAGIYINAGYEIGVASTKAYTSQYVAIVLLALKLSEDFISRSDLRKQIIKGLIKLPDQIKTILECKNQVKKLAKKLVKFRSIICLGRGEQYATAKEAALKIKELSYIHAEGIASGELKHGPLALVDETVPVVAIATHDRLFVKTQNALHQIKARAGQLVIICHKNSPFKTSFETNVEVIHVPQAESEHLQGILNIIPLQFLSMYLAVEAGRNIDRPRHLAKSVTVG